MKGLLFFLFSLSFIVVADGQICASLGGWSLTNDNGDGTCDYNISVIVDSGNGASGTVTFSIGGSTVHVEPACTCNPTTISFPVTVTCGSTIVVDVVYNAPGNGNDCSGSTNDIVLPVEWLDIQGSNERNFNLINWSVFEEAGNLKYIIEHSESGRDFLEIGEVVDPQPGNHLSSYTYIDNNPVNGLNYYRIKQIDFDNTFSYSEIIVIRNEESRKISVYPNPFQNEIYLKNAEATSWKLLNLDGQIIRTGKEDEIDTSLLPSGIYYLYMLSGTDVSVEHLIKI